ncbi:hypothetical protein HDU98_003884, partial [Podochytrium sp. JEL0797]
MADALRLILAHLLSPQQPLRTLFAPAAANALQQMMVLKHVDRAPLARDLLVLLVDFVLATDTELDPQSEDNARDRLDARIETSEVIYTMIKKQANTAILEQEPALLERLLFEWARCDDSNLQFKLLNIATRLLRDVRDDLVQQFNVPAEVRNLRTLGLEDHRLFLHKQNNLKSNTRLWPKTFQVDGLLYRVGRRSRTIADLHCTPGNSFWIDFNVDYVVILFYDETGQHCAVELIYEKVDSFSVTHSGLRLTLRDPFNATDAMSVESEGPYRVELKWASGIVAAG